MQGEPALDLHEGLHDALPATDAGGDRLDWDVVIELPPPRPRRRVAVRLHKRGRSRPVPVPRSD